MPEITSFTPVMHTNKELDLDAYHLKTCNNPREPNGASVQCKEDKVGSPDPPKDVMSHPPSPDQEWPRAPKSVFSARDEGPLPRTRLLGQGIEGETEHEHNTAHMLPKTYNQKERRQQVHHQTPWPPLPSSHVSLCRQKWNVRKGKKAFALRMP